MIHRETIAIQPVADHHNIDAICGAGRRRKLKKLAGRKDADIFSVQGTILTVFNFQDLGRGKRKNSVNARQGKSIGFRVN